MSNQYRIVMDVPIDADSPEEAAEKFREWLRNQDDVFSPLIDVVGQEDLEAGSVVSIEADPIPMDIAVFEWWEREQRSHLKPCLEHFDDSPDMTEDEAEQNCGFYSRLSAPGFLDCTEWDGPHETKYLAMEALFNAFGE